MDIPVVLSHKTAWLFLHAPNRNRLRRILASRPIFKPGTKASALASRLRDVLSACGIPRDKLEKIDVLFSFAAERGNSPDFRSHALGRLLEGNLVEPVCPGVLVVRPELCFIQATVWMEPLEALEFGFELCGRYESMAPLGKKGYRERPPLTTPADIRAVAERLPRLPGSHKTILALARIRSGSRSPMETAVALSILCSQKDGGLGCFDIEMNRRIPIPADMRRFFSFDHIEIDLFSPSANAGIEYDGSYHAELKRRTHDMDRSSALSMLGIPIRTISAQHLSSQLAFHRTLNAVAQLLGITPPASAAFQRRQNELRLSLIRNWS